jgi:carboxyl-terminal processing protease
MLDFLLPEGDLVSKTDRDGNTTVLYTSDESCVDLPMAVLVNGSTASAAELFACDLQEYGVAKVVGTTTYGKGVMQTTYSLSDGSSMTLTTDYYNPSSGVNYNGVGVIPDIVRELTEEEQSNFVHFDPEHDPQLAAALDYLNGQTDK